MLSQDFDAVIFDCDGTLVDSEPISIFALVEYAREFGLELDAKEALGLFVGRDMLGIVAELESRMGESLPKHFCVEFRRRQEIALREKLQIIPGADDLLSAMNKPYCIASNAPQEKIAINLEVTSLDRFFEPSTTFSAYDINIWKPQPDLFLYAAQKMVMEPKRCVVIEDSLAGVQAGLAADMQVIGYVADGDRSPFGDVEIPFVDSLSALINVLCV